MKVLTLTILLIAVSTSRFNPEQLKHACIRSSQHVKLCIYSVIEPVAKEHINRHQHG